MIRRSYVVAQVVKNLASVEEVPDGILRQHSYDISLMPDEESSDSSGDLLYLCGLSEREIGEIEPGSVVELTVRPEEQEPCLATSAVEPVN